MQIATVNKPLRLSWLARFCLHISRHSPEFETNTLYVTTDALGANAFARILVI